MKMNEKTQRLLELIRENPELPIVPIVNDRLLGDDECGYYMGNFGNARVDEYLIGECDEWGNKKAIWKSDDDVYDTLDEFLPTKEFENLPESDEECRKIYENLPWVKAIIVYIEPWGE